MSPRIKKLIATLLIVLVWLPVYALFVDGPGRACPAAAPPGMSACCFYALAGTLWIVPIGLALPWMYREPRKTDDRQHANSTVSN